jgi:hypothetical protein
MEPEPIPTAHSINPYQQSVILQPCKLCPPFIARQRLGNHVFEATKYTTTEELFGSMFMSIPVYLTSLLGNNSVYTFPEN